MLDLGHRSGAGGGLVLDRGRWCYTGELAPGVGRWRPVPEKVAGRWSLAFELGSLNRWNLALELAPDPGHRGPALEMTTELESRWPGGG